MSVVKSAKVWLGGRKGITAPIRVSQYDTGWQFQLTVYDGDGIYVGSGDEIAVLNGKKANGAAFSVAGTFASGVATFDCPVTITEAVGVTECELRLTSAGETVGTANFDMIVEKAPLSGYYASGEDFSAVAQLIDNMVGRVPDAAADWLEENITNPSNPPIDTSLSVSGAAADAAVVGDLVSKYFPVEDYTAENKFGFADMPLNSHTYTYAYKFADAPSDLAGIEALLYVSQSAANYYENVRFCVCYAMYRNKLYVGRYIPASSAAVNWDEVASKSDLTGLETDVDALEADIDGLADKMSQYFPVTDYTAENKFGFADMPLNSYTYSFANKFADIPSGIVGTNPVYISQIQANPNGSVRYCICYDKAADILFVGLYRPSLDPQMSWTRIASRAEVDAVQTDIDAAKKDGGLVIDMMNPVYGLGRYVDGESNGISFAWAADQRSCNVTGTATGLAFSNILVYQNELPSCVQPGGLLTIETKGLSRGGVYLHLYLYPNTLPNRSIYIVEDTSIPIPASCIGILARLEVGSGTALGSGGVDVSVKVYTGQTQLNAADSNGIKLLVYGSSFSYSTLGLVPEILREIAPDRRFVLGICYQSGATVQDHIDNWSSGTKYSVYSEYDSAVGLWTNLSSTVSGKEAMDRHTWDYIVLQQASRYVTAEADYMALESFADSIIQYVRHPVSFLYNLIQALNAGATFPAQYTQATGKEKSDAMFLDMADYAQRALDDKIISDVIPGGTAVQNARTTSLDSLGIGGDLSEDNLGHLQNGIPTLIPAYAAAYKICQIAGIKPKMYGIPLSPTDDWLTAYNLQTRVSHGTCVGVTEANKRIAQKCAMMAITHPFEISDMSNY